MSRQKRGVQYVQQDEPAFLKRLKQQAGYKEGPTVDTKREDRQERDSDSDTEKDEEKPQVVVIKSGDLTEDQAKHFEKEAETKPREVGSEKVVFKKPTKKEDSDAEKNKKEKKKSTAKKVKNSSLLSFNDEDEAEDT